MNFFSYYIAILKNWGVIYLGHQDSRVWNDVSDVLTILNWSQMGDTIFGCLWRYKSGWLWSNLERKRAWWNLATWPTTLISPWTSKMVSYLLNPFVVWSFSSQLIIFQSFGDVIIAGEGLQFLTYDRHYIEGSLARHTYCDKGHPYIMVISQDPWHSHLLPSVWQ